MKCSGFSLLALAPATIPTSTSVGSTHPMKLGEILIQLGMLRPEQLKAVLDERNLLGGRIGTQLVERGLLDTDQVSEALGRQMRMPAALQRHFDKADPGIVAMLKPNLAVRYMAIPLVAARSGPKRIVVAMATPQDVLALDEVSFALGARVEPMVAAELAIARNLKRFYNVDINLARPVRPEPPPSVVRASGSREIAAMTPAAPFHAQRAPHVESPAPTGSIPSLAPPLGAAVSLEDAVHRLSVAEHREQIADIIIDFMLPRFGCGLIFLLRGENAHVWRGFAAGVDARAIETIAFPISMPSVFRTVRDRAATFRGPPPAEGKHLHTQIWKYLHCEAPAEILAIPIVLGERVITIVYAHASRESMLADGDVQELQAMCAAAASSFVRLIHQAKEGQQPTKLVPR
jgi:hypothetical protein